MKIYLEQSVDTVKTLVQRVDQVAGDEIVQNVSERVAVAVLHFRRRCVHAVMIPSTFNTKTKAQTVLAGCCF